MWTDSSRHSTVANRTTQETTRPPGKDRFSTFSTMIKTTEDISLFFREIRRAGTPSVAARTPLFRELRPDTRLWSKLSDHNREPFRRPDLAQTGNPSVALINIYHALCCWLSLLGAPDSAPVSSAEDIPSELMLELVVVWRRGADAALTDGASSLAVVPWRTL